MDIFVYCFFSCLGGLILGVLISHKRPDGKLKIDTSDPEKDLWSLELTAPLDDISKSHFLTLKVENLSQN